MRGEANKKTMHNPESFSMEWGGRTLTIETGKLAGLANGAARVQYGETVVLSTITLSRHIRDGLDYFPLMVDYEEKLYAAGKIKGSRFVKREGRPTDLAILNARIVDRTLRPLFDHRMRNDLQIVSTVLSVDQENDPSFISLIAASAAVAISDIPAAGPAVGLTVARVDGAFILNPTPDQKLAADLYMFAGVRDGKIVMLEAEGKQATEDAVLGGIEFALENGKTVIDLINDVQAKVGKEKIKIEFPEPSAEVKSMQEAVSAKVRPFIEKNIDSLFGIKGKQERMDKEDAFQKQLADMFESDDEKSFARSIYEEMYEESFRTLMLEKDIRVDGRGLTELRGLYAEVDELPRTHGSAVFQRGETQVLSVVTLGGPGDAQIIDGLEPEYKKRYLHHYNFPAFSVGEVKPLRGPSRRDIGHGFLAEKALESMIPAKEDFPYTIRVVSEVLMSNGSSSQASACASSMALMAAGVPIIAPVAGIAMGLVMTEDQSKYKVLTDIQGIEDHSGDMDFKIAGTKNGVTAIQLDIKLDGISVDICRDTLAQAKQARLEILDVMLKAIPETRAEMSPYAPRIETIQIDPEKIGDVIGSGGKIINGIIEETNVQIDIEDDGNVFITAVDMDGMARAKKMIEDIVRDIEVGEIYEGHVLKIVTDRTKGSEIGAVIDLGGGRDGMIHISNVCHGRINKISDVLEMDDLVKVKVIEVDSERGRIGLSRKDLIEPGTPDPKCEAATQAGGGSDFQDRGPRGPRPPRPDFDRGPRPAGPSASRVSPPGRFAKHD